MIHSSHRSESNAALVWTGILALVLVVAGLAPSPEFSKGIAAYLPLHISLEVFAVVIGAMIFAVVWDTQTYSSTARILILGVVTLGVAMIDLLHALSFPGMPDFVTPGSTEKTINFWLAGRLLLAMGLLGAAWLPNSTDPWLNRQSRYLWLGLVLLLVFALAVWFLYFPQWVPATFDSVSGLTDFKVISEYVLMLFYLLAAWGFYRRMSHAYVLSAANLAAASVIFAMSEYFFTLYADVTDMYNLLGHVYKIIGFAFLYRGVFKRVVRMPFRDLQDARERLELTIRTLPDTLLEMDRTGTILKTYSPVMTKSVADEYLREGVCIGDVLSKTAATHWINGLKVAEIKGAKSHVKIQLPAKPEPAYLDLSIAARPGLAPEAPTFLVLVRDVSEIVQQQALLALQAGVNQLLLEIEESLESKDETSFLQMAVDRLAAVSRSPVRLVHVLADDGLTIQRTFASEGAEGFAGDDRYWHQALKKQETVIVNATASPGGEPDGLLRFVTIPVLESTKVRLLLTVGNKSTDYTQTDVDILNRVAESVWRGIRMRRQEVVIMTLSTALGQSPYPVLITDTKAQIVYVNDAFSRVSGYTPQEVIGNSPHMLKSGLTPPEVYKDMWGRLLKGTTWHGELINRRKDGTVYTERATIYPVRDPTGEVINYVAHKEDITLQKETEQRIHQLANYDQVTGLVNREVFEVTLKELIARKHEADLPLVVLWLDLDNFKSVNDSLGHDAGNLLLVKISNRLRRELGEQITLARISGDSFVALLPHTDQQAAALLAKHLLEVVQAPVRLQLHQVAISASIGMSIYPDDSESANGLLMNAETAMYRVKLEGRNGIRFFSQDMQAYSLRALEIASALKQADMDKEFHMVYQPQMSIIDGRFVGAEALLRWIHPVWGNVSPAEFIPIAEQSGRILDIGTWVLKHVVEQIRVWRETGLGDFSVAINLSALQFIQDDMVQSFVDTVTGAGVPPRCIEVELTESVAMNNPQTAGLAISALRKAGFQVSIDDFGTGYSSMSYLKRFAVDKLKVDQSFVRDLEHDADDQGIVMAIVQMAHSLGMKAIAEGVETEGQLSILKAKGCDEMQGYLYSRPLTADAFESFIKQRKVQH